MDFVVGIAKEMTEIFLVQVKNLIGTIFSPELDFITKMLTLFCMVSIFFEFVYLIVPRSLKRKIENLDLPLNKPGETRWSTTIACGNLFGLVLVILQKFSMAKSSEEKLLEGRIEREFRHRMSFLGDMRIYQLFISSAIWLSLKFFMQVSRDEQEAEQFCEDVRRGVKESVKNLN
jgi:hypothetical protein